MGIGNYWRVSHEFMLLGVRGGLTFADRGLRSWLECASRCPEGTLKELGLTKKQSSNYQAIAELPEDAFEEALPRARARRLGDLPLRF